MTPTDPSLPTPVVWEHNRSIVDQIVQCVEDGVYCAVLGPRFYGKTALLRHVQQKLKDSARPVIHLDLFEIQAPTQAEFFANLAGVIAHGISKHSAGPNLVPTEEMGPVVFQSFLSRCVSSLGAHLTVIFDHLESLPTDLNRALLSSLRDLHLEQQGQDLRFIAIVSGALNLEALTVSETSPFHGIARRLIVGDLDEAESRALVATHLESSEVHVSPPAREYLLEATRGNPHLIKYICRRSLTVGARNPSRQVTVNTVGHVIREFLEIEAPSYGPLHEAVRLIEDDPDLLQCILKLLKSEIVPLQELSLSAREDLDPLYLTGLVERVGGDCYRIRNRIYQRYLSEHFDAARAGYLLTVCGRWDAAIGHLEQSITSGNEQSRADLLAATISAIYACETEDQAAYYLMRGLSAGFHVSQISVWLLAAQRQTLQLVDRKGTTFEGALPIDVHEIPLDADRIEARSCRQACILRENQENAITRYVIPLINPGHAPLGVVTLWDSMNGRTVTEHRKREFALQSYLNQAARALYEVEFRKRREARATEQDAQLEKQTHQLFLLHRVSTLAQTLADIDKISHLILTAITAHFGLGFNRAWLFLIDEEENHLVGRMGIGSFTEDQAYHAWASPPSFDEYLERLYSEQIQPDVIDTPTRKMSFPVAETSHDLFSMTVYQHHTFQWSGAPGHWHALPGDFRQTFEPGEMILTPLVVHNNCLGLIAVDNKFRPRPYTESDELLLKTYANQMATALFNHQQHEQEKQRLRLEETLRDTSLMIASSLELKEVLHRILEEMKKVLPFDTASIQLANDETKSLKIIADTGFDDPESVEALDFPLKDHFPNVLVFEQREPLHFDDIQKHFFNFSDPYYQATHVHGWLGAPLISNGRPIGVITLDSRKTGIYTSEHDSLAVLFAGQASVAIENARLFEKERETKEYLDLLISSSQDGIIAVDNEGWVIRYSEGAQKILGYAPEEVLDKKKRVDELYGSLDIAKDINKQLVNSDRVRDYETTVLDRDNHPIPIVLSASLLRDRAGRPLGSVGFFKDMRPLRRVENNLRMILDTVSLMSKVDHSEAGLSALAERIVTAQPVTFCKILLLDETQKFLIVKAAYPVTRRQGKGVKWKPATGSKIPLTPSNLMTHLIQLPEARVFQQGQTIEEIEVVRTLQELVAIEEDIRSVLIIPLEAGSEVFGICILGETRAWSRSPFDKDKVELVSSMVTQGTVFVDRLQAHEATQSKLQMVEKLRSIGEDLVIASPDFTKTILNKVVQTACEVTGANSAIIYPWDNQQRTYYRDRIVHFGLKKERLFSDKIRNEESSMTGIVLKRGIVIVDDIENGLDRAGNTHIWARDGGFLETEGVRAFVGIAMRVGEEPLGVLFVNFLEPHYFSKSELEAVRLFANQAVIAIENARLYEGQDLKLQESTTLQQLGTLLAETHDSTLVLDHVMQAAFKLIHADAGNVVFYDKNTDLFLDDALMSTGLDQPLQPYKTRVRQRNGYSYEIIKSGRTISIPNTMADPHISQVTLAKGRGAVLGVPLVGRENPVGVLWVNWNKPRKISERDETLLTALASQAALSIENVRLFDQLKEENIRRNEESRALQEVGVSLTETIELNKVLYRVLQAALKVLDGDEVTILFYDENRAEFDLEAWTCAGLDQPLGTYRTQVRQGGGLAYQIVRNREPVFIPDTLQDPRISRVAIEKGRRATVGVPMLDHDGPVGVLWVNWKAPRQVSSGEASLLTALASQATVAIKGARRYEEVQRRSTHLEAVHKAGKVISAASVGLDRQQVLDQILEQAIECVSSASKSKASVGTIHMVEEESNELVVKSVFPKSYPQQRIAQFSRIPLDPQKTKDGRIGISGKAVLTRQPQLVPDVSESADYIAHNEETQSELAIPLMDNERVIGVMDVESNELNAFDEMDQNSLRLLVDLAVVALRNAEQAEQLSRSNAVGLMGAWGAEIVHDVNREVGYIRREVFDLRQEPGLPVEIAEGLKVIEQSAARLALPEIPERIPGTETTASAATSHLDATIERAIAVYHSGHPYISFTFEQGCPGVRVAMHERFLLAIVSHLIRNAGYALERMTTDKKICIRSHVEASWAVFEIEDSGPGLRPELIPVLFKRLVPHEDGRKGRGLLLVGFLVGQHGGRIENVRGEEQGACFRIWLPLASPAESTVE